MKRVRIQLDYVLQLEDDFDTTKFHNINDLIEFGFSRLPEIREGDSALLEKGAFIAITNLRKNEHVK